VVVTLPSGARERISGCAPRQINTRVACDQAERDHIQRVLRPDLAPRPAAKEVRFSEFAKEFMSTYVKANNKESEQEAKRSILDGHLIPALGDLGLSEITVREVEKLKAKLDDGERSRKRVNNILGCLSKLLNYAAEIEVLAAAPRIRLLKVGKQSFRFLNFEELDALLAVARHEPLWLSAVLLGADAGLRLGEIRALRWSHRDRTTGRVDVTRTFWQGKEGPAKTWNLRSIPSTDRLGAALAAIRHLRGPYVLADADGAPLTMETMRWHLPRLAAAAKLEPFGWHALRHTFCSHLAMRGVPARTIQQLAGHTNLTTTMRYMHLVPGAAEDAIAMLEGRGKGVANAVDPAAKKRT
jgi:integrase